MDNEKNNEMLDDNAPDNDVTTDDTEKMPPDDTEETVEEVKEEINGETDDKGDRVTPDRTRLKKKLVKLVPAVLIIVCAVSLLTSAAWAAMTNYVFFPKLDEALENALEPKLDIGTEFDISDLIEQGRIQVELSDIKEPDIEKLLLSLGYNQNGAALNVALDENEMCAIVTQKGLAVSSDGIDGGEYYGFGFKDLEERYKDSPIAHRGESEYAFDKQTHKSVLELIERLEEMNDGSSDTKKNIENVQKAIARAFKKSEISKCEYSYGGIKVNGTARSARCKLYSFEKQELVEFVENLIEEFDDPSAALERSLDELGLADGGDGIIVERLENILDQLDADDGKWKVDLAFAYVDNAMSAIVGKITHKEGEVRLTLDLGEDPKSDTDIYFTLDWNEYVLSEDQEKISAVHKSKLYASYVASRENEKGTATLVLGCDINSGESDNVKYDITAKGIFDDRSNKADLSLTVNENGYLLFDALVECKMEDKASSLSLDLEKVTYKSNGKDTDVELPCDIKLTLYKSAGSIRLPHFEDVLEMDASEFDKLYEKTEKYLDELAEQYGLSRLGINIGGGNTDVPDGEEYTEGEEKENEELNNIGGTIYAEAFPESSDMELYGYYEQVTNDRIVEHYNFISATTFLHDAGQGTKSGKYRIDLEKGRIYFEVQEYPEPYYLVKTFEQIDENTIKIGYDTFRFKYSTK